MPFAASDSFYRQAKERGLRARSAFKLEQIHQQFGILHGVERALDLCAAPGSWSQVLSEILHKKRGEQGKSTKLVAVDIQEMAPIPHVSIVQGDITKQETMNEIVSLFDNQKIDLCVCDGAPDVTGLHEIDEFVHSQLLFAAINIATHLLAKGGTFVAKIFKDECYDLLEAQLRLFFAHVICFKPSSSRASSAEHFVVCRNFTPRDDYQPTLFTIAADMKSAPDGKVDSQVLSFVACGDLVHSDSSSSTTPSRPNSQPQSTPDAQAASQLAKYSSFIS